MLQFQLNNRAVEQTPYRRPTRYMFLSIPKSTAKVGLLAYKTKAKFE